MFEQCVEAPALLGSKPGTEAALDLSACLVTQIGAESFQPDG